MSLDQFLNNRMNTNSAEADEEYILKRARYRLEFDPSNNEYALRISVSDFPSSESSKT
jgi:hypothetical protein